MSTEINTLGRVHNFSAGPAAIPLPALQRAREELLNFQGTGMSVMELSHRGAAYEKLHQEAKSLVRNLLDLPEDYDSLFLQGGASLHFAMLPMNFLKHGKSADYLLTGSWSKKALKEAKLFGKTRVPASTEDTGFDRVPLPGEIDLDPEAAYLHITSNNTIYGTQYHDFPDSGEVPLVADMSSDIMSRPLDIRRFALIYAGAQKNLGPAGLTLVILRKSWLEKANPGLTSMLSYQTHIKADSRYNTPPSFGVYLLRNVLAWIAENGGLEGMDAGNREKAKHLYKIIDNSGGFYRGHAQTNSRSLMNITFRLPDEELEKRFLAEAQKEGLVQLKGHRSVGGIRASIYNALGMESVRALGDFMESFRC